MGDIRGIKAKPLYRGENADIACRDCGATNPAYCARWCPGRVRDDDAPPLEVAEPSR